MSHDSDQRLRGLDPAQASESARAPASVGGLKRLLAQFFGTERSTAIIHEYSQRLGRSLAERDQVPGELAERAERLLADFLGGPAARAVCGAAIYGQPLSHEGLMELLAATAQEIEHSRRLEMKSGQLEKATRELSEANKRLQELDQLKDEFVSMVSHELRTPLTSIRAFGEILLNNPEMDIDQRSEFLEVVVRESERLTRLINQVLDLSKIESGTAEWQLDEVDLGRIAHQAAESTQQLFSERRVELQLDIGTEETAIKGDPDRLTQLVINLLANAAKFTDSDHGKVWLRLSAGRGDTIRLEVADNGPGISAEDQRRIFAKFHQVSTHQTGKPKGSGLGLAICQLIIDAHWGRLWVESEPGNGASFLCELPRAGGEHCNVTGYVDLSGRT